ncbi:MAG TPA: hypothetical protein PK668_26050 [Myxococcota bacterium]|nr:hypothetical protein [Myxococcota bacterium]HRY96989.1 hypothetical protein [Myxococcota bacterium]HSA23676.1 hypothetical protein [Myxococcota bacterium]
MKTRDVDGDIGSAQGPIGWAFFRPVLHGGALQVPSDTAPFGLAEKCREVLQIGTVRQAMITFTVRRNRARVMVPEHLSARCQRPVASPEELARLPEIAAEPSDILRQLPRHRLSSVLTAMVRERGTFLDLARAYRDVRRMCEDAARNQKLSGELTALCALAQAVLADEIAFVRRQSPEDVAAELEAMFADPAQATQGSASPRPEPRRQPAKNGRKPAAKGPDRTKKST